MAKVKNRGLDKLLKQIDDIVVKMPDIAGQMTRAGAEVANKNLEANSRRAFRFAGDVNKHLIITKTYQRKGGIVATKTGFTGYLPTEKTEKGVPVMIRGYSNSKGVPVPLLINLAEYGTHGRMPKPLAKYWNGIKVPIVRSAARDKAIVGAMSKKAKDLSGGYLDEQ